MDLAHYEPRNDEVGLTEANARINSARVRDYAFLIRHSAKTPLNESDVDLLAHVLADFKSRGGSVSSADIVAALLDHGIPDENAVNILNSVFN